MYPATGWSGGQPRRSSAGSLPWTHSRPATPQPAGECPGRVHRVVVVGGGFGGLQAVRLLRNAAVEVTLVDRRNYHLFQPLLYQVATGALSPEEIAQPLRGILARQRNARVVLADVTDIDLQRHCVRLRAQANGEPAMTWLMTR